MSGARFFHDAVWRGIISWLFAAVLLLCAAPGGRAAELTVFAAASLTDALKEIGTSFEKTTGTRVLFNFASSSLLERQIEEGAPANIFISADRAKMDALEKRGLIATNSRVALLSNRLVVVVPKESGIRAAADLRKVQRLALAQTQTVPAGIYAREYLERAGLWRELESRVIPTGNVRGALAAVESGNADAAIVYRTDAAISKKVKIAYEIPAEQTAPIVYPAAVVRGFDSPEARSFLNWLRSGAARAAFARFGFVLPEK